MGRTLRAADQPLSAEEVSHLAGLSRVTARRFLQLPRRSPPFWYISTEFPIEGAVVAPHLRAVDVESGELIWMTEGRPETLLQGVDPAVFPDLVVVMDVPRFVAGHDTNTT